MPTLVERCIHQIQPLEVHVLFKENWKWCEGCAYDPENNKRCHNYSPTTYQLDGKSLNLTSSPPLNLNEVRA
jgi:hypothetical protein